MKKRLLTTITLLWVMCLLGIPALADTGPKPALTITVQHPPQEPYYLDLLVQRDAPYDNLYEARGNLDKEMLELLKSQMANGWYPALSYGNGIPLHGKLTGEPIKNGTMMHRFSYFGVPEEYRIFIVTESGEMTLSVPMQKEAFQEKVTFDYEKAQQTPFGQAEVGQKNQLMAYFIQFLTTLLPTLLLEGVVLVLFRYPLRRNLRPFLAANIATQVLLTVALGTVLHQTGLIEAYLLLPLLELIIFAVEAAYYHKVLVRPAGPGKPVLYAFVANLLSFGCGFLMMNFEFGIHTMF